MRKPNSSSKYSLFSSHPPQTHCGFPPKIANIKSLPDLRAFTLPPAWALLHSQPPRRHLQVPSLYLKQAKTDPYPTTLLPSRHFSQTVIILIICSTRFILQVSTELSPPPGRPDPQTRWTRTLGSCRPALPRLSSLPEDALDTTEHWWVLGAWRGGWASCAPESSTWLLRRSRICREQLNLSRLPSWAESCRPLSLLSARYSSRRFMFIFKAVAGAAGGRRVTGRAPRTWPRAPAAQWAARHRPAPGLGLSEQHEGCPDRLHTAARPLARGSPSSVRGCPAGCTPPPSPPPGAHQAV